MLREAIEFLITKGVQSANPIVRAESEPAHVYYIRQPDGSLSREHAIAPPVKQIAHSLATIAQVARDEIDVGGEMWFSSSGVTLRHGIDLRQTTTLPLLLSAQLRQLVAWRDQPSHLTQADLIRVLRTTFRDSLSAAPQLIDILRKIKFNSGTQINAEVGHGRASLGKEIMGEVTGSGLIPDYVRFNVPLFANACLRSVRANVECALEPNASTGQFQVIPMPAQIEDALDVGTTAIGAILRESLPKDYPLYHGSPS